MGKSSMAMNLFWLAILVWLHPLASPKAAAEAAIPCNQVYSLIPCLTYVNGGTTVPDMCCKGFRTLWGMCKTTPDRQAVCRCIKNAVSGIPYSNNALTLAASLPRKCGINIPYQITPKVDCNRVP